MALAREEALLKFDSEIQKAKKEAKSPLATYVFDPENKDPKNHEKFIKLIREKTPTALVKELNEKKLSEEQFKQFQVITSHQEEYKTLFELPPSRWFSILTEEKTSGEDLVSLIGNDYIGAFSGVLDSILELPDKEICVKSLFFLHHSPHADEKQVKAFLNEIKYPNADQASFMSLHPIYHNQTVEQKAQGFLVSKRPATEVFLRIDANHAPEEQARVHATLRIMHECVTYHHDRILQSLPVDIQKKITKEEHLIKKRQKKISLEKKSSDEAIRLFRELNGSDASIPGITPSPSEAINQLIQLLLLAQSQPLQERKISAPSPRQYSFFGDSISSSEVKTPFSEIKPLTQEHKHSPVVSQPTPMPDFKLSLPPFLRDIAPAASSPSFFSPSPSSRDYDYGDDKDPDMQKALESSLKIQNKYDSDLQQALELSTIDQEELDTRRAIQLSMSTPKAGR